MGSLVGHVAPGFGFFIIGLWHLFNNIIIHILNHHPSDNYSKSTNSLFLSWFPTPRFKYFEPLLIMAGSTLSVSMELIIGPRKHQPFDTDGTIPSYHLQNFEHSNISLTFFLFASFSILLDRLRPKAYFELTQLLGAIAFGQELFVFHLHSADHIGPEGQYHLILQLLVVVCFATTLLGIRFPKSFLVAFVRSISILFQGVWFIVMGFALWTPSLVAKGCYIYSKDGDHKVVRCVGDEALHRAKSLINIQFSWLLIVITSLALFFYLVLVKVYEDHSKLEVVQYFSVLTKEEEESVYDVESQNKDKLGVSE